MQSSGEMCRCSLWCRREHQGRFCRLIYFNPLVRACGPPLLLCTFCRVSVFSPLFFPPPVQYTVTHAAQQHLGRVKKKYWPKRAFTDTQQESMSQPLAVEPLSSAVNESGRQMGRLIALVKFSEPRTILDLAVSKVIDL
jgi:hypothetical protein